MLNNKYFKKLIKLIRAYKYSLKGYQFIITDDMFEIKLSYNDEFNRDTETTWIAYNDQADRIGLDTVFYSIEKFLNDIYPNIIKEN